MSNWNYEDAEQEFLQNRGKVIAPSNSSYAKILFYWSSYIKRRSKKGLVPIFITGSGTSFSADIPDIWGIVDELNRSFKTRPSTEFPHLNIIFEKYLQMKKSGSSDRSIVASILNAFQETPELTLNEWEGMNRWLSDKILSAKPTDFHESLVDLYEKIQALCLTLNFDGLLIRQLVEKKFKAFSLPSDKECEAYFIRLYESQNESYKAFLEIQIRGDILYLKCQSVDFCPNKLGESKHSLWANVASVNHDNYEELLNCPYCGKRGVSLLSFPGSYEKENDMQRMLAIVWRYLAFRISSVTVVGLSGEWDPLIVAFLGDLLSERSIPLRKKRLNAPTFGRCIKSPVTQAKKLV